MRFIPINEGGAEVGPAELIKYTDDKFKEVNVIVITAVVVLLVMVAALVFDFFNNNQARYEKFIDKTQEIRNDFYSKDYLDNHFINKSDYYPKDDLKSLFIENTKNAQILECFKNRGSFSVKCY